jgi:DNA-binding XRE family transcriptional regulator
MEQKNLTLNNNALLSKSQGLEEKEVEALSLKPFFEDYSLVPIFGNLQELPLLVCVGTVEGDFVVFHESLWRALLDRGVKKVRALFYKGVWDMAELFYLREKLFKRRKKALVEFYYFAYKNFYGEDFYRNRAQAIQAISQKANITRRTVYAYLWKHLREERKELKRKAEDLYSQGRTQMEVARLLGVPRQTISDWLKKGEEGREKPHTGGAR